MSKAQYIPIEMGGVRIGTAMIQNHQLVLSVQDKNIRGALWGEAEDRKLERIAIHGYQIELFEKESGNTNA